MKQERKHRAIELCKDALILLLTGSALWLAAQTQLLAPLNGLLHEDRPQAVTGQVQGSGQTGSAIPLTMVVNLPGGEGMPEGTELPSQRESIRMGIAHDQASCQNLFQQVAGVLVESMSGAGAPEVISREQWEEALTQKLSVYMDFQGELPASVLAAWLSGGDTQLQGNIRCMVLAAEEEAVVLYYRDETDGTYYRFQSGMGEADVLSEVLSTYTENGAFYAFESEEYSTLAPDTLLFPSSPSLGVYTVSNPVNDGEDSLRALVQDLGFSLNSTNFYPTDDWVARSEDNSIRLSERGTVEFTAGDDKGGLPVLAGSGDSVSRGVETCRKLAATLLGSRCGEAQLYLSAVRETGGTLEVEFEYSLNGVPVCFEQGSAASFVVSNGQITQFTMRFRSYASSGTTSAVMPPKQALAAFSALGLEGQELVLTYSDNGGDTVTAGWSAREWEAGEE